MSRWYSTYTGYDWNPGYGYSDLFVSYVRAIREQFHVEKPNGGSPGVEYSTGYWKPYNVQNRSVLVCLDRFEWKHYSESAGVYFKMKLRVAMKGNPMLRMFNKVSPVRVIFDEEIWVMFRNDFPHSPPLFRVNNSHYSGLTDLHHHHIFGDGTMCILADDSDWNPDRDTILRAINAAVDWIVWHTETWGENPERWS